MIVRRVRFTETARDHINLERTWWLTNRDHQELFATELAEAVAVLAIFPAAGAPYRGRTGDDIRRLYLRKIGCHVYFSFDDEEVIVRAVWGARLERGPRIG